MRDTPPPTSTPPSVAAPSPGAPNGRERRAAQARAVLHYRGLTEQSDPDANWAYDKFVTRARTLFYARLSFLAIGLALLAVPAWSAVFGIHGHLGFVVYFTMLAYSIANFLVVEHRGIGRAATFVTLCFDLLVVVYLIEASGGLQSPLLVTQLLFTTLFVILFPKPLAILPPLLTLPIVAKLDQLLAIRELGFLDLLVLVWYSTLNFIIVYVMVYLNEREEAAHREVVSLERDLQGLAVIEERNRLAREIHDGLGASLSSVIIQAEYLETIAGEDETLRKEIGELKGCAEESIEELRRSLRMMRADFDFEPAVEDYCRTFSDRTRLPVKFEHGGAAQPLGNEVQLTVFRILQESLTNARKHSQASEVRVRLGFQAQHLNLEISDDGVGFAADDSTPRGHYGLTNMRERAAKLGGEIEIISAPGQGTRIRLTLPLAANWPTRQTARAAG